VGRGGIVRDGAVHRAVLGEVVAGLAAHGLVVTAVMRSPLTGADGNVEFLARAVASGAAGTPVTDAALDALVEVAA
jgi:23S rRNA (cytidine1920-2'-O)/16S rRNA (cytidine1409-2'-O)-methyltransferase